MYRFIKSLLLFIFIALDCHIAMANSIAIKNNLGIPLYTHIDNSVPAKKKIKKKPQSLQDFAAKIGQSVAVDGNEDTNGESLHDFAARIGREDTSSQTLNSYQQEPNEKGDYTGPSHVYIS